MYPLYQLTGVATGDLKGFWQSTQWMWSLGKLWRHHRLQGSAQSHDEKWFLCEHNIMCHSWFSHEKLEGDFLVPWLCSTAKPLRENAIRSFSNKDARMPAHFSVQHTDIIQIYIWQYYWSISLWYYSIFVIGLLFPPDSCHYSYCPSCSVTFESKPLLTQIGKERDWKKPLVL